MPSVDTGGYPCLGQPTQARLEPPMRFRTKAKVRMLLDTPADRLAPIRLRVCLRVTRAGGACAKEAYPPPRRGPARTGEPPKFSPLFHGPDF